MTDESDSTSPIIFVSYRRDDAAWVAASLSQCLINAFGSDSVFVDVDAISPGARFADSIQDALGRTSVLVVVIGKAWLKAADKDGRRRLDKRNDWVRKEICKGLDKASCTVIPVLVDDAELPAKAALPKAMAELVDRNTASMHHARASRDIEDLINTIAATGISRLSVPNVATLKDLRSGYCNLGPLTLCADLKSPTGVGRPDAYPTGSPGAHFVFHLHNSSHAVFLVAAIEVEVVSWKDANVQVLQHGVGATVVSRRFFVAVSRDRGRYVAQFVGAANRNEYVSVLPNETEPFDVAVAATIPGLYSVRVHAVGSIAGSHIDLPIAAGPSSILFFDRSSPPLVDRGWGGPPMAYFDYIREMSNYDPALGEYGGLDDVV